MSFKDKLVKFLSFNFGVPKPMNWGYPLMFCSLGALAVFLIRYAFFKAQTDFSATSLMGYSLFMPIFIVISLLVPSIFFAERNQAPMLGRYTGIGVIFLSFFSGIPLMLINSSFHNIIAYIWLRLGNKAIFPAFFYMTSDDSINALFLRIITETLIPAIGISVFFFGLIWSRFKKSDENKAMIAITLIFCLYNLNLIDIVGIAVMGWWLSFLRSRTENIWGPVAAITGMKLTEIFFSGTLPQVNLASIITYSDIQSSYFYASAPAIFVAVILFGFFMKLLNDFSYTYNSNLYGEDSEDTEMSEHNKNLPPFERGINMALIISVIVFVVLWVLVFKGYQI